MFGNHLRRTRWGSKYMSANCRACRQCVAGMSVACRGRVAVVCPRYRCVAACYKRLDFIGVGGVGAGGCVLFSLCFLRCEAANHFCGIALRPASPRTLGPTLEIPGRRNSPAFPPLFSATSCSRPVRFHSRQWTVVNHTSHKRTVCCGESGASWAWEGGGYTGGWGTARDARTHR